MQFDLIYVLLLLFISVLFLFSVKCYRVYSCFCTAARLITVKILCIGTDRSELTVQTQIRLLLLGAV